MKDYKQKKAAAQEKRDAWIRKQVLEKKRTRAEVATEIGLTPMRVGQIVKAAEAAKEVQV